LERASIFVFVSAGQVEKVITVMSNPRQYKIPDWFLNRQKDIKDGKYSQALSNVLDSKIREDLERLKKIRAHRGLRHYWGFVALYTLSVLSSDVKTGFSSTGRRFVKTGLLSVIETSLLPKSTVINLARA